MTSLPFSRFRYTQKRRYSKYVFLKAFKSHIIEHLLIPFNRMVPSLHVRQHLVHRNYSFLYRILSFLLLYHEVSFEVLK
jgi:hypothetical protein